MKSCLAGLFVGALLIAAPAAGAETIQTVDTISVVGIGRVPISPSATTAEADTVYHQALVQAAVDGSLKAHVLAEATGARVGPIEAISERGSKNVECKDAAGESASYKGATPDSGTAEATTVAVKLSAPPTPASPAHKAGHAKKRKTRKAIRRKTHRVLARTAENTAASCELGAELSLIFNLE